MKRSGSWVVECPLEDGARLERLRYGGVDLLTQTPPQFRAPDKPHGRDESRLVCGYDDGFPSVDACDGWPGRGKLSRLAGSGSEVSARAAARGGELWYA